jgi:hypothetical protein
MPPPPPSHVRCALRRLRHQPSVASPTTTDPNHGRDPWRAVVRSRAGAAVSVYVRARRCVVCPCTGRTRAPATDEGKRLRPGSVCTARGGAGPRDGQHPAEHLAQGRPRPAQPAKPPAPDRQAARRRQRAPQVCALCATAAAHVWLALGPGASLLIGGGGGWGQLRAARAGAADAV